MINIVDLKFQGLARSIAAYFIESSDGPIVVETGPHSTLPHLEAGLRAKGYELSDVKHVFLTHIHLDHAGAAWAFAEKGATIYMHPFGERHMIDPSKLHASAKMIYKDKMDSLWGLLKPIPKNQIRIVKHGEQFNIGGIEIIGWNTPGHAVHHIAYQIGRSLIAGDVAGARINEGGMVVPPCPPPDINIEHWMTSIKLIEGLDLEAIYIAHFGKVTQIEKHLEELKAILWDWANWIRPYYDDATHPSEITPKFTAYVTQQLLDYGISKDDLPIYENANPSWMSVLGLLRYWKKKLEK